MQTINTQFKYYAFISYCHKDEKYAKWLQNNLESYSLPTQIKHDNPNLKKGIRPIFRDKTDLGAGVLYDNIKEELSASKSLIVICSPESAKSEWVGKEVKEFLNTHQPDDIIPFIVDGTPNSNDDKECFNQAIKDVTPELLGVSIVEIGRQQALTKVVAKLLNVRYDVLWQRHLRREKRKKFIWGVAALLLVLFGIFGWDCARPKYEYYADYVDCFGIPKGVIQLNRQEISHRSRMYRFCYRRQLDIKNFRQWRLSEVDYVNSAGTVQEISDTERRGRFAIQKLQFGKSGALVAIEYCNPKGKTLLRHEMSSRDNVPATIVDFKSAVEGQGEGFLGAQTTSSSLGLMDENNQKSNIIRYAYQRDENGYITRMTYHANNAYDLRSSAAYDSDGIAGISYERDSLGRVVTLRYIDADYQLCCTKTGIAGRRYEYDRYGNIFRATYFDKNVHPVYNELGWAICEDVADEYGNIVEESYYGINGGISLNNDNVARILYKNDSHGNWIERTFYGKNDSTCFCKYNFSKSSRKYDARGNVIEEIFYDNNDLICLRKEGLAKITRKFDEQDNVIEESYYGTNGELCLLSNDGYAKFTCRYDERGNVIEESYYGTNGEPCLSNYGYAKVTSRYDERGNMIESVYYGTDGEPCLSNSGYSKWSRRYDERGNEIEVSLYGVDGKPCLGDEGFHASLSTYNTRGFVIERTVLGLNNEKINCTYGFCTIKRVFDDWGRLTETSYEDTEGNPVAPLGYYKEKRFYNDRGKMVRTEIYDQNDRLVSNTYQTQIVVSVDGKALKENVEVGSILLKLNNWVIGDDYETLITISEQRNVDKCFVMLTPSGELKKYRIERGLFGITSEQQAIEVSQVNEWKEKFNLDEL